MLIVRNLAIDYFSKIILETFVTRLKINIEDKYMLVDVYVNYVIRISDQRSIYNKLNKIFPVLYQLIVRRSSQYSYCLPL